MLKFAQKENTLEIIFENRLDSEECHKIDEELKQKLTDINPKKIIFNLENVSYIASAFLRICLTALKEYGAENFVIINTSPEVKKVFKIAGIDQYIDIK